jgi:hypothetical protein
MRTPDGREVLPDRKEARDREQEREPTEASPGEDVRPARPTPLLEPRIVHACASSRAIAVRATTLEGAQRDGAASVEHRAHAGVGAGARSTGRHRPVRGGE